MGFRALRDDKPGSAKSGCSAIHKCRRNENGRAGFFLQTTLAPAPAPPARRLRAGSRRNGGTPAGPIRQANRSFARRPRRKRFQNAGSTRAAIRARGLPSLPAASTGIQAQRQSSHLSAGELGSFGSAWPDYLNVLRNSVPIRAAVKMVEYCGTVKAKQAKVRTGNEQMEGAECWHIKPRFTS